MDLKKRDKNYKLEREERKKLQQRVRWYQEREEELKAERRMFKNLADLSEGRHKEELRIMKGNAEIKIDARRTEVEQKIQEMCIWEDPDLHIYLFI